MTFDWCDELAQQLRFHWTQQLSPRIDDLTDAEYFWEPTPGMWSIRRSSSTGQMTNDFVVPPPHPEPVTTVAWRLHHLVVVFEGAMVQLGGEEISWEYFSRPAETAETAISMLGRRVDEWLDRLQSSTQSDLEQPARTQFVRDAGLSVAGAVLHTHRELIHHGAEIALLRDLFGQLANGTDNGNLMP